MSYSYSVEQVKVTPQAECVLHNAVTISFRGFFRMQREQGLVEDAKGTGFMDRTL